MVTEEHLGWHHIQHTIHDIAKNKWNKIIKESMHINSLLHDTNTHERILVPYSHKIWWLCIGKLKIINSWRNNRRKNYVCVLFHGFWTFRQYERTITKSLAEEPTDAGTFFEVDAVRNHRSTKFCSCCVGRTGWPRHRISTYKGNREELSFSINKESKSFQVFFLEENWDELTSASLVRSSFLTRYLWRNETGIFPSLSTENRSILTSNENVWRQN